MTTGFRPSSAPALVSELRELMSRYADLTSAQQGALEAGMTRRAAALAKTAAQVLESAGRTSRRLTATRSLHPIQGPEWDDLASGLQSAHACAQANLDGLGQVLARERTRLLREIGQLETSVAGPEWSPSPAVLNITT